MRIELYLNVLKVVVFVSGVIVLILNLLPTSLFQHPTTPRSFRQFLESNAFLRDHLDFSDFDVENEVFDDLQVPVDPYYLFLLSAAKQYIITARVRSTTGR